MPRATDVIRHEHATILAVVRIMEEMAARHQAGDALAVQDMPTVIGFFLKYADGLHHAKEEYILFPAILRHSTQCIALLDQLLDEHQHSLRIIGAIDTALLHGDQAAYFAAIRGYLQFIYAHIDVEDDVLLPLADSVLSAEEQEELAQQLSALDAEYLPSLDLPTWSARQQELEARYLRTT